MLFANDFFIPRGDLMAGYSYFDYDQMTLLGIEVHSDELELLQKAAEEYDWKAIGAPRSAKCNVENTAIGCP